MAYKQKLDNGVIAKPGRGHRLNSFAALVAEGENPNGLMVQTPNGTSREDHKQFERAYNVNTDRWTKNEDWDGDMSGI
jgi:hypothetical protein